MRLALALAIALPAGVGLTLADPDPSPAAAGGCVGFSSVSFDPPGTDASNLNGEWVKVTNECYNMIDFGGWQVKNRAGKVYTFANGTRMGHGSIYLHSGKGTNRPGHRYWGHTAPVWNNTADTAYLVNRGGTVVATKTRTAFSPTSSSSAATSVPFGSRPRSGAISLKNCRDVTISNKTIRDLGSNVIAIRLENCHNVTITNVDFINVAEGVYALDSTNIKVLDSRYQNIVGPHQRVGLNRGNFVQFHNVNGGRIDHNKGKGGDTEDVVSLYHTSNVIVEDNHFEGTNWTSTSGSGIALSDGDGSNNIARRNTLVNIGQVGIFISSGNNNRIENNVIYGAPRTNSNVGIYVWKLTGISCSGHTVSGNKVYYRKPDGTESGFWNGGGCSVSTSGNDFSAPLTESNLRVAL